MASRPDSSIKPSIQELKQAFDSEYLSRRRKNSTIQACSHKLPPTLYHYTSAQGLNGIIERGTIWYTNVAFFNDASELNYGLNQVEKALKTIQTDPVFVQMVGDIYKNIPETVDVYVACFCERGDLLNQWHGYGERGGGYSVGLHAEDLASIIEGTDSVLRKVEYDPDIQVRLSQAHISCAGEALNHVILSYDVGAAELEELKRHSLFKVLSSISVVVASMKDSVFQGEEEWRLVRYRSRQLQPSPDVAFRVTGQLTVPYIPTRLCFKETNVLPISEVTIGPTVNRLAERSTKDLLRRYEMWKISGREVVLKRSEVPLQNLI
jgi:hypothetical protein